MFAALRTAVITFAVGPDRNAEETVIVIDLGNVQA
jgi:hypothetical protein